MLHKETVSEETLEMIQRLMNDPKLKDFYLVGGTAMSLQLGHRKSIDIDLFTQVKFDQKELEKHIRQILDPDLVLFRSHGIEVTCGKENMDFWHYPVPMIKQPLEIEGIRMLSIEDIAAMKMNSIAFDGTRIKDFLDIYKVLEKRSLNDLTKVYSEKYPDLPAKEHAKMVADTKGVDERKFSMLDKKITWGKVERRLRQAVLFPDKIFRNGLDRGKGKGL